MKSYNLPEHHKQAFATSKQAGVWCPNAQAPQGPVREEIDLPNSPRPHCLPSYRAYVQTKHGEHVLVDGVLCEATQVQIGLSRDKSETWFLAKVVQS